MTLAGTSAGLIAMNSFVNFAIHVPSLCFFFFFFYRLCVALLCFARVDEGSPVINARPEGLALTHFVKLM